MTQGVYWLLTIPHHFFLPYLPDGVKWIKGQLEQGSDTGYIHWQLFVCFSRSVRLGAVKSLFGDGIHAELSRSAAAEAYVWKEDTRISGTQFELGSKPLKRNSSKDWDSILESAKRGRLDEVPSDVLVRHYSSLRRIAADHLTPQPMERIIYVFWGPTGVGKSRMAWSEGGLASYPKDPLSKFWDGYRGQEHVIIDEFRGTVNISHVLRWFDRYPVIVEIKGSSVPLVAKKIWITSNLHPKDWYPDLDSSTVSALLRRLNITHFDSL